MLNSWSLVVYFKKDNRKLITQIKLDNTILLGVITQSFNWKYWLFLFYMCLIFQEYPYFYQFYYRNDREQKGTFIEKSVKHCFSSLQM